VVEANIMPRPMRRSGNSARDLSILDQTSAASSCKPRSRAALFALGDVPDDLTRTQLLATEQRGVDEWQMPTSTQGLKMVPYPAINKETYRLYLPVKT
jgi:hypothetical protein